MFLLFSSCTSLAPWYLHVTRAGIVLDFNISSYCDISFVVQYQQSNLALQLELTAVELATRREDALA